MHRTLSFDLNQTESHHGFSVCWRYRKEKVPILTQYCGTGDQCDGPVISPLLCDFVLVYKACNKRMRLHYDVVLFMAHLHEFLLSTTLWHFAYYSRLLGRGDGIAFGSVCIYACMHICMYVYSHNSKNIDQISLMLLHNIGCLRGSVLLEGG